MKNILTKLIITLLFISSINNSISAQHKSNFSFLVGANINNPHLLFENSNNPSDVYAEKAFGNLYLSVLYKNRAQLMIINEITESNTRYTYNNDVFLGTRFYLLKDTVKLKPYVEAGTILNSYGDKTIELKSVFGVFYGAGLTYKLNKYVYFELGLNYQIKEIVYNDNIWPPAYSPFQINSERYMIKTGLIFKMF